MMLTALIVLGAVVMLLLPGLPTPVVLLALAAARTFTDVGAPTSGPQTSSSVLAGAIGVALLVLALLANRSAPPLPRRLRDAIAVFVAVVLVWTGVGVLQFGIDTTMLSESLRLLSVLAALICAVRFGQRGGSLGEIWPALVIVPAAVVLLLLFAAGSEVGLESGRASGTFSHSNSAAAFLAAGVLVLIYSLFRRRSVVMLVSALIAGAALLATGSIGSVLGVLAGTVAMFLARPGTRVITRVVAAVVVVGGAIGFVLVSTVGQRIQEFSDYDPNAALASGTSTDSLEWRIINWTDLLNTWSKSPVLGWGVGSTAGHLQPLGEPPHSMFVQVLVEYGALGFVALLALAIWSVRRATRSARGTTEYGLFIALVVFVIVTGSESNLIDYTAADYLIAITAGVALGRVAGRASHAVPRPATAAVAARSDRSPVAAR